MRAAVYDVTSGPVAVREVPDPQPGPGEVVLAVRATGICRSDWHAWHGRESVVLPHIGGHEYAGEVVAVGAAVTSFTVGDRVTAPFVCGCGRCEFCRAGDAQVCPHQVQPGFDLPGSFADYVVVPAAEANLVRLPESVGFGEAAAMGCRFGTAYRAVAAHGRPRPGQWVAVHGCGGVGLSAIMVARALGARVVAVDVAPSARARAEQLGADVIIATEPAGGEIDKVAAAIGAAVVDATGGGAHVSLDAIGSASAATASMYSLRRRGRHVQVGLLHGAEVHPPLPIDRLIGWELEVLGSHGMPARDYPAMLDMVVAGTLRPADLITRTTDWAGIGPALAAMDQPGSDGITVAVPSPAPKPLPPRVPERFSRKHGAGTDDGLSELHL